MNLSKNSKEMKTIVETFIMEETVELTYDQDKLDKWNELIQELGLEGQTKIVSMDKSPIPFMFMNNTLVNVAQTLCPRKVKVQDYNATPIPLEIMELIAMSVREKYFSKIQIWYDDKTPDPFAIGITEEFYLKKKGSWDNHEDETTFRSEEYANDYIKLHDLIAEPQQRYSEAKYYLIGKWADVKQSFAELTVRARNRYIEETSLRYRKQIKEAERSLADVLIEAEEKFGNI